MEGRGVRGFTSLDCFIGSRGAVLQHSNLASKDLFQQNNS